MKIGSITIDQPICLAPMEDVTDQAFRIICRRFGADIVYTEFTSSEAIIRDVPRALKKIKVSDEERPVGIQLFGGLERSMEEAARVATIFKPDLIDINCGCWVKNHVARGEGAALLKDLDQFERIVRSSVKATHLPVTVKTRLGWDKDSIVIMDVAKMVEQAGAKALTVHCRTRSQAHQGEADWGWLHKIKSVVSIPVIGNGDITAVEGAKAMLSTGCDGVMIGRGAIGNPWIFKQIKHFINTGQHLAAPTIKERIKVCIEHLKLAVELKGLREGLIPFRKYYAGYLKGFPNAAGLRSDLMTYNKLEQVIERLYQFLDQHEAVGAGIPS